MPDPLVSRRNLGFLAAGAAAAAAAPALGQPGAKGGMVAGLTTGDWMAQVRAQHREIDRHFQLVKAAKTDAERMSHFRMLASLLSGHSLAEEVALYPGLFMQGEEADSKEAYAEQSMAKVLTARIDAAMAMGRRDEAMKLIGQLETAVKAHVAHEETDWYPALMKKATAQMNAKMTADFRREFTKYMA